MKVLSFFTMALATFNEKMALRNLQIAASTYCDATNINGLDVTHEIRAETNVIIANDLVQDAQIFSFRGSSNIENWISNIQVRFASPYADTNIKIHKGLYDEYLIYKETLLQNLNASANSVIVSGHSSGAALAMMFAYDIHNLNYSVTAYTYGKPRIGNSAFAKSAENITHYRITHADDIVPHLPEEVFGYRHTGTEVWFYDDSDNYIVCADAEDPDCSNSCAPIKCTSISDHMYYMMTNIGSEYC